MRKDHSITGTTILQTTIEDADNTRLYGWYDKSIDKGSHWTLRRFGVQHHRQSDRRPIGITPPMEDLWELLHLILDNNVFRYQKTFFKQIRGLAMGNPLSGTLAIFCMDKFERNHIYNELEPKIYVRYVDNIGTVVKTVS